MKYTNAMIKKADEAIRDEGEDPNIPQYSVADIEDFVERGDVTEENYEGISDRVYEIVADTGANLRPLKKLLRACKTW
jgi:hypothetical protein